MQNDAHRVQPGTQHSASLLWLPRRLEVPIWYLISLGHGAIDLAVAYASGGPAAKMVKPFAFEGWDFRTHCRLLPAQPLGWGSSSIGRKLQTPYGMEWELDLFPRLPDNAYPKEAMTAAELVQWLSREFVDLMGHAHNLEQIFRDPALLVRTGYLFARAAYRQGDLTSKPHAAALSMVALGATWFLREESCAICFRRSVPGLDRCAVHSQSKFNGLGTKPERSEQVQKSRAATALTRSLGALGATFLKPDDAHSFGWTMAGILWPMYGTEVASWRSEVDEALVESPIVSALLPAGFSAMHFQGRLAALRAAVDPGQWIVRRWPARIMAAQRWIAAERVLAPGHREGLSDKNRVRVELALQMLSTGTRHAQVALALQISRSHLSHLLRRARSVGAGTGAAPELAGAIVRPTSRTGTTASVHADHAVAAHEVNCAKNGMTSEPRLASVLASRLLRPNVLDEGLRSGLFLARNPDSDCWDVLVPDLVTALKCLGAQVILVDLADYRAVSLETLRRKLFAELRALDGKVSSSEHAEQGVTGEETLAALIGRVVELGGRDLVVILDHVRRLRGRSGSQLLKALKAARDAVNLRPEATRYFVLVATDIDATAVRELAMDSSQAFYGATIEDLPQI